jgi:hypothetical protein
MTGHLTDLDPLDIGPAQRVALDADTAVELIEALESCCDWFDRDRSRLDTSLFRYCGYDLTALRGDLRRLADRVGHAPLTDTTPP